MTIINGLHNKWRQDKAYQEAYDALEDEFALAATLIEARSRADLTQSEPDSVHHALKLYSV